MSRASGSGEPGFLGLLTLLFVALKLTGHIGWSWWWVLSPVWLPLVGGLALVAIAVVARR